MSKKFSLENCPTCMVLNCSCGENVSDAVEVVIIKPRCVQSYEKF